jgi:release factor glutamine methyltransferase
VYEPADDSFLLADHLKHEVRSKDIILDLGTGCGIQAIISTTVKKDTQIIATDINSIAINNALKNARLNNVTDRIEFIHGDLFQPIYKKKHFSLIIFNAPYLPVPRPNQKMKDWISLAWAQGIDTNIIQTFLSKCHIYLKNKGRILMVLSSLSHLDLKKWERLYSIEKLAERAFFFEKIILIKMKNT